MEKQIVKNTIQQAIVNHFEQIKHIQEKEVIDRGDTAYLYLTRVPIDSICEEIEYAMDDKEYDITGWGELSVDKQREIVILLVRGLGYFVFENKYSCTITGLTLRTPKGYSKDAVLFINPAFQEYCRKRREIR